MLMAKQKKGLYEAKNGRTRDRILDEAETLFARKGYHAVSVREITNAANCNLAAVNYHFGNKQNLYLEVFRSRWLPRATQVHASFRKTLKANGDLTPSTVVQSLAQAFLDGPLTDTERKRHHQLISGELAQPTEAFYWMIFMLRCRRKWKVSSWPLMRSASLPWCCILTWRVLLSLDLPGTPLMITSKRVWSITSSIFH
jgi:AcrR family transcriptional regulator